MNTPIESKERPLSIEFLSFFDSNRLYRLGVHNYLIINEKVKPYGIIKAFYGTIKAIHGKDKAFHGMIKGFHGAIKAFAGCLKRFMGRLKNHGIFKASRKIVKANRFRGTIKAFGRILNEKSFAG